MVSHAILVFSLTSLLFNKCSPMKHESSCSRKMCGDQLVLTHLIKQNKVDEARQLARVHLDKSPKVTSYAAYFTVNEKFNSNLFFWFFPSQTNYVDDPVVLWLQGGPGDSSLNSIFTENGPFSATKDGKLKMRKFSWTIRHSMLYIDNPVGTGFSFTDEGGYATNETQVGSQLYEALLQFFALFPELKRNDFFVTGESYAGKFVPAVSCAILEHNSDAALEDKINLQGLAIANGISDPLHQLNFGDYYYQIGLIDEHGKKIFQESEQNIANLIENHNYEQATKDLHLLAGSILTNLTGFTSHLNYLFPEDNRIDLEYMNRFLQSPKVRAEIHVGNASFSSPNDVVITHLLADRTISVAPCISKLLSNYRVLIFSGQLDLTIPYPTTVNYLQNLNFSAAQEYKEAPRHRWYVDEQLSGYVKRAGNLTEVLVRNAGHLIMRDQPRWALDLITRFTRNKDYN